MKSSLHKKHIVIVGASSGLGKELAKQLATEGAILYLLSRKVHTTEFAFAAERIQCDVTNPENITEAFQSIDKFTDKIDIMINCAGIGLVKKLEETSHQEITNVIQTNLIGGIFASQEGYKRMLKHKSGHIINVSSTSGLKTRADETIYCASKWGLRGFTESLRLAAVVHKIRVTGIYPGGMQTNFWKDNEPKNLESYMLPEDIAEQIVSLLKSPSAIAPSELVIERGF